MNWLCLLCLQLLVLKFTIGINNPEEEVEEPIKAVDEPPQQMPYVPPTIVHQPGVMMMGQPMYGGMGQPMMVSALKMATRPLHAS